MEKKSRIPGFYKLSPKERLELVKEFAELTDEEAELIGDPGALKIEDVDRMIENVVGTMEIPMGVATNFKIDGRDYLIPMAIEETSVVAAASNAAKMARVKGGFQTDVTEPVMIGQIQVVDAPDPNEAKRGVLANRERLLKLANEQDPMLVKFGGGARDIEVKILDTEGGAMLRVHLLVDVRDAMGANAVNTMAEALSPLIEEITGGKTLLRIISNLAIYRLARARAVFAKETLGEDAVDKIVKAYLFAKNDIFRCATHNKGVMNGIVAVALATGQDHRAIEAGAHAYAAMDHYKPLTRYYKNKDGDLVGEIELPMAVGTIGGATKVHPGFKVGLKILGVRKAQELARIMAAVGLAQNFAAVRALSMEGIQKGHMSLHARNIAVMAGARGELVDKVAKQMVDEGNIKMDRAREIVGGLQVS